jgi:hypothetical protein
MTMVIAAAANAPAMIAGQETAEGAGVVLSTDVGTTTTVSDAMGSSHLVARWLENAARKAKVPHRRFWYEIGLQHRRTSGAVKSGVRAA